MQFGRKQIKKCLKIQVWLLLNSLYLMAQPWHWQARDPENGQIKFFILADSLYPVGENLFAAHLGRECILFRESPLFPVSRKSDVIYKPLNNRFFASFTEKKWKIRECSKPLKHTEETYSDIKIWRGQILAHSEKGWKMIRKSGEELQADSIRVFPDNLFLFQREGIHRIDSALKGRFYKTSTTIRAINGPFFTYLQQDSLWIPIHGIGLKCKVYPDARWWNDTSLIDGRPGNFYLQTPRIGRIKIADSLTIIHRHLLHLRHRNKEFLLFSNGKKISVGKVNSIKIIHDSLFAFRSEKLWILVNKYGKKYPLKPVISDVGQSKGSYLTVCSGKRWGCVDFSGVIRISCRYDSLLPPENGRIGAKIGQFWGFLDEDERIRIQPNFDFVQPFEDSSILVKREGKWGLIRWDGTYEQNCEFDSISKLPDGNWKLKKGKWAGLTDPSGKFLLNTRYSDIIETPNNHIKVIREGKEGLFNHAGEILMPLEFTRIIVHPMPGLIISR